jgi:IclR family pca regulon transcriptional regulator
MEVDDIASIVVLEKDEIIFVARSTPRRIVSPLIGIGTRMPAYSAATGRVLLAARDDAEIKRMLSSASPRLRRTPRSKIDDRDILQAIAKVRANGYALNDEEIEIGLRSMAVPVRGSAGSVLAAMSVSVQSTRLTPAQMIEQILPAMLEGSRQLGMML